MPSSQTLNSSLFERSVFLVQLRWLLFLDNLYYDPSSLIVLMNRMTKCTLIKDEIVFPRHGSIFVLLIARIYSERERWRETAFHFTRE